MSAAKVDTRGIGLIGTKSTPESEASLSTNATSETLSLHTDDNTVDRHVFACNLKPPSWRSAKINTASSRLQK